jgi:pentatricopeptide repeat protein
MDELNKCGENSDAKPNVRSFNTVINAYAKSGHADSALKAESVLDLMERLYEAGNEDVRPDVHSFSTVINGESNFNFSAWPLLMLPYLIYSLAWRGASRLEKLNVPRIYSGR